MVGRHGLGNVGGSSSLRWPSSVAGLPDSSRAGLALHDDNGRLELFHAPALEEAGIRRVLLDVGRLTLLGGIVVLVVFHFIRLFLGFVVRMGNGWTFCRPAGRRYGWGFRHRRILSGIAVTRDHITRFASFKMSDEHGIALR